MIFPYLYTKEIVDPKAQDNFKRITNYFKASPIDRCDFKFFEVEASGTFLYPHNLAYTPKDVILLHNLNNATVTFNYANFTRTDISITVSAPTTLRFLLGRYEDVL